jgi:hypothetical protein
MAKQKSELPSWASGGGTSSRGFSSHSSLPSWAGGSRGQSDFWSKKKKKKGGGFWRSVERYSGAELGSHLAKDVGEAAVGFFPGVYTAARTLGADLAHEALHPGTASQYSPWGGEKSQFYKKVAKPTGKQYAYTYGPLLHGHPGRTLGRVYQHPLGPALDLLTIADLGLTGAAKLGIRTAGRDVIETQSPRLVHTGKGPALQEVTPTREISKARIRGTAKARTAAEKATGRLIEKAGGPEQTLRKEGLKGEYKRYGKGISKRVEENTLERLTHYQPYAKAVKRLSEKEWQALHIRARDVHPDDLAEALQGTPLEKVVKDPKVRELVDNPSKRMDIAEEEARALSKRGEGLIKLDPEAVAYRPQLWKDTISALLEPVERQVTRRVREVVPPPDAATNRDWGEYLNLANRDTPMGTSERARFDELNKKFSQNVERTFPVREKRTAREIHGDPYYVPDAIEPVRSAPPIGARGGGKAPPSKLGAQKFSKAILAMTGRAHFSSDVLGPEFLRRVKKVKYEETHNALLRGAIPVTGDQLREMGGLPKDWEFIRQKPSTRVPPTLKPETGEPLPTFEQRLAHAQEQQSSLAQQIPNPEDLQESAFSKAGFSTTSPEEAKKVGDSYFIAPKNMVKAATGEFTRSSDFVYNWMRRPLSVWRALVLGLRPGFLVNNLIGNSLMYTVKTGGQGAIRDLFGAIMETHGPKVGWRILRNPATPPELRESLYREFFPEQYHGTFGRTQSPAVSPAHIAGRKAAEVGRTITGAIPRATSVVAEEIPRTALLRHYIRKSPEFRQVYKSMPRQTRTFEKAARHLMEGQTTKAYQRAISKQVDEALGNYTHMSPAERNVLRNAFPFYSWYRAIASTTFHLAADTPLRANILGKLGQIGKQWSDEELGNLPRRLEGAIGLGPGSGGTEHALRTQGWNPWATLTQLQSGLSTDVTDIGANPFVIGLASAMARQRQGVGGVPLVAQTAQDIVRSLPPVQLAFPYQPSRLYPKRTRGNALYSWLGVPIIDYSPQQAHYQASQGK